MNEQTTPEVGIATATEAPKSALDYIVALSGGPTRADIQRWKEQAPGHTLQVLATDDETVFLMRGINGIELAEIQGNIPKGSTNPDLDIQIAVAAKCCQWTSTTSGKKLDEMGLRAGPAGLPSTLFNIVMDLSMFMAPEKVAMFSGKI